MITKVGLVGFGYWGPNLARNFSSLGNCSLVAICEQDPQRAEMARRAYPQCAILSDYKDIVADPAIDAVLIATPISTHYDLVKRALEANKDVLVEKTFAQNLAEGRRLFDLAMAKQRVLAVDHTFVYTGAVQRIKRYVDDGELGPLLYFDSVRVNLGLFQQDVNVLYDLSSHDISILCFLLAEDPIWVQAMGACHAREGQENLAYLHMEYAGGMVAHHHLSWLAPVKIRRTLICGANKMIVYDDLEASEKVKVYDKGIVVSQADRDATNAIRVDYRTGDMVAPKLAHREALKTEAEHFINCVQTRKQPLSDGLMGLRVLSILEAAQQSLREDGRRVRLEPLIV